MKGTLAKLTPAELLERKHTLFQSEWSGKGATCPACGGQRPGSSAFTEVVGHRQHGHLFR